MAYISLHVCYSFVGGLWHMELSNNFLVIPRGPSINQYYSSTQLCFNIQLFGVHLSECLFPSQTITTTKKTNELRTQNIKLESFEVSLAKVLNFFDLKLCNNLFSFTTHFTLVIIILFKTILDISHMNFDDMTVRSLVREIMFLSDKDTLV